MVYAAGWIEGAGMNVMLRFFFIKMDMSPVAFLVLALLMTGSGGVFAAESADAGQAGSLPRVLLIGDSICGGYQKTVKDQLAGRVEVVKNEGNAQYTGTGLKKIDEWLGDGKWDIIHFNWGLWDMYGWEYDKEDRSPAAYAKRLEELVVRMGKTGARLIWATTTPACPEAEKGMRDRFKKPVRIDRATERQYQDAALDVMKRHNVAVNDLYALMLPDLKKYQLAPDDVHFNSAGCEALGRQVADMILKQIKVPDTGKSQAAAPAGMSLINSVEKAAAHPIVSKRPAVDFFEGAVLGNGGLGAIVTTRPDAIEIHFGHNDVWDIRIAEKNREEIGTFKEVFAKIKAISGNLDDDKWFADYRAKCRENYAKPYPRPFPCGRAVLWFDRREAELLGHRVNIDSGLCRIDFLIRGKKVFFELFADMTEDKLWGRMVTDSGEPVEAPFKYITLLPDPTTPSEFPKYTSAKDNPGGVLSFRQVLPFEECSGNKPYSRNSRDKAFCLTAAVNSGFDEKASLFTGAGGNNSGTKQMGPLQGWFKKSSDFVICFDLKNGRESAIEPGVGRAVIASGEAYDSAAVKSRMVWMEYWGKSGIAVDDEIIERTWYWNLYFLRCALRPGVTCPGLFANWSSKNIGTAWHGDYHMNYNTQQPFWATFSCNHVDLHLPYVDMVEKTLLPVSKMWAKEYYNMRGAFFPHSAYPVEMTMNPYPVPGWGWEVFETPWTVQSLWWHYTYTMDEKFLKDRAFGVIKEAVLFLVDYIKRPDTHGKEWGDDNYHIYPSVPPELYGVKPGFDKNIDTLADLTLTRFVFNAYLQACSALDIEGPEKDLVADVKDILSHLSDYPRAVSKRGEVWVSVKGEDPEIVYNCPVSLMTVFPGEDHGLDSPPNEYGLALNTYRQQQNEGGNDLVFLNVQAARLGVLDIEKFKRQVEYCLLPNGTCTDKVLQIHGRYGNETSFNFMAGMGIWFENFSLPFVINECLLQGYNGNLRFFPNWPEEKDAEFRSLRTAGAFLVSAKRSGGRVQWIEVSSEAGKPLTVISPWKSKVICKSAAGEKVMDGERFTLETKPGERLLFTPVEKAE